MTTLSVEEMHRYAAKAAGCIFGIRQAGDGNQVPCIMDQHADWERWEPSENDRQSAMLALALDMEIIQPYLNEWGGGPFVKCTPKHFSDCLVCLPVVGDATQATREAIFLSAVKVGQQL